MWIQGNIPVNIMFIDLGQYSISTVAICVSWCRAVCEDSTLRSSVRIHCINVHTSLQCWVEHFVHQYLYKRGKEEMYQGPGEGCSLYLSRVMVFHFSCSRSSLSGNSRKRTAVLTAALTKPRLNSSSNKLCIYTFRKRPAPDADTFSASRGCPHTGSELRLLWYKPLRVSMFSKNILLACQCHLSSWSPCGKIELEPRPRQN